MGSRAQDFLGSLEGFSSYSVDTLLGEDVGKGEAWQALGKWRLWPGLYFWR